MRIFDAHLHADCRSLEELETMALFGTEIAVTCAVGSGFSATVSLLDYWQRIVTKEPPRAKRNCIRLGVALGLHPVAAGQPGVPGALESLPELLRSPGVVAAGELGLETGAAAEAELLRQQLSLVKELSLPCVLHTPEENKLPVTHQVIELLERLGVDKNLILLDHVNEETYELVREYGTWIGLTVHPRSLSPQRAARLLQRYGGERAILSSDVGRDPADIWALPRTLLECRRLGVESTVQERAVYRNAWDFYQVDSQRWNSL
jgi:hypothetical protein